MKIALVMFLSFITLSGYARTYECSISTPGRAVSYVETFELTLDNYRYTNNYGLTAILMQSERFYKFSLGEGDYGFDTLAFTVVSKDTPFVLVGSSDDKPTLQCKLKP